MRTSEFARSTKMLPLAVCTVAAPLADATVTSPLALSRPSSPSWPTRDTSADAVWAWQLDPAGALMVRSRPVRSRSPYFLGPLTTSLPLSKVTRTCSISSSRFVFGELGTTSTVITSVASPETATLPVAHALMWIEAGSGHGNSQVVITVPFGIAWGVNGGGGG